MKLTQLVPPPESDAAVLDCCTAKIRGGEGGEIGGDPNGHAI